jgi:hypothetical protein
MDQKLIFWEVMMTDPTATGRIKIMKIPAGEAPLKIRKAWIGLVLPCHPILGFSPGKEKGVLSNKSAGRGNCGFSVPQCDAIVILANHDRAAARWWEKQGFPVPKECFFFAEDEAKIISGVRRQALVQVEDDMQGDPYR